MANFKWNQRKNFWERGLNPLNIDLSHRCPLECPQCARQRHFRNHGQKVPGKDLSLDDFEKIAEYFKLITFCGQLSDPIHHPKFIEILEICKNKKVDTEVSTASSMKPKKWYKDAFEIYPRARWIFGIDGLPDESHKYRVNQDGKKLFDIMVDAKNHLRTKPIWQYIIFLYNQDNIDTAIDIAKQHGLDFKIINSARWSSDDDPFKPTITR
jgi:MoaA/NifB/PqqE/SkfB family radical SAM enzyme